MKQSRRNHSSKVKARIALDALRGDTTLSELSSRHGGHAHQISTWRKPLRERAGRTRALTIARRTRCTSEPMK